MSASDVHAGYPRFPGHLRGDSRMEELVVLGHAVWQPAACLRLADQAGGHVAEDTIREIRRMNAYCAVDVGHLGAKQKGPRFVVRTWVQSVATTRIAMVVAMNVKLGPE